GLAVRQRVELDTRSECGTKRVPRLTRLWDTPRTVAADQQPVAIVWARRIVPAFGANGHAESVPRNPAAASLRFPLVTRHPDQDRRVASPSARARGGRRRPLQNFVA